MSRVRTFVSDVAMILDHYVFHCRWEWLCDVVELSIRDFYGANCECD